VLDNQRTLKELEITSGSMIQYVVGAVGSGWVEVDGHANPHEAFQASHLHD
jgi:hypothetical protein